MSRKKSEANISGWLSARPDSKEKRFIQVGNSLLLSGTFQKLSSGARYTYFCMAMESGGKRDFIFPLSAAKKYGIAKNSIGRHITELIEANFITMQSGKIVRQPNLYSFSFEWKSQETDK